ncbi:hypothetical protein DVH05_022650 [Phytophthora capsici]|nr:hypothetical protein DVH05_022650 [Phytophthora capsici]
MAQLSGSARVLSVMQELRQLRDKVCILSEKNRSLAKALTGAKQELTKARAAQTAMFSDKEWMETRRRPAEGGLTWSFNVAQFNTALFNAVSRAHAELSLIPSLNRSRHIPHFGAKELYNHVNRCDQTPRMPTSPVLYTRAPPIFACTKVIDRAVEENASTLASDTTKVVPANSSRKKHQHVNSSSERAGYQAGMKRRLRQRDTIMSYAEPKLNTKLRRGDYYGLGRQPIHRPPKPRAISGPRGAKSAIVPARFGQRSPFRGRPTTRASKRISYVEPKLNTKLRQGDKFTFTT